MPHRPAKRGKRAPAPPPATDLGMLRHVRALGLGSVDDYRAWCRQHGFRPSPSKSWQEQREERRAAQKSLTDAAAQAELMRHVAALGLKTLDAYRAWCRERGFSEGPNKSRQQRQQERLAAERERAAATLESARRRARRPEETIRAIAAGEIEFETLGSPVLQEVHRAFQATDCVPQVREAFLSLLLHVHRQTRLFTNQPVIAALGQAPSNNPIQGLLALARHHAAWRRAVDDWRPESRSTRRQFGSLARHLLAQYHVPAFMDAAWFEGGTAAEGHHAERGLSSPRAQRHQEWFKHIGIGQNIRTADIPLQLTKRMAHEFLFAPDDLPIEAALRYGQVLGLGGSEPLARVVIATRLGEMQEDEEFWVSVLHFLVNNPMLDPDCVGPVIDYAHQRRFVAPETDEEERGPDEAGGAIGEDGAAPRPAAEFSMKGRTAPALLRLVEEWHRQLAREVRRRPLDWASVGIGGFEQLEDVAGTLRRWTIHEILSDRELREEGKAMSHCVASYARSCARQHTSIWSMQVEECRTGVRRRVMTIAVNNLRKVITEARGRCNQLPGARRASIRLHEAPAILKQWANQEGLVLPKYV